MNNYAIVNNGEVLESFKAATADDALETMHLLGYDRVDGDILELLPSNQNKFDNKETKAL